VRRSSRPRERIAFSGMMQEDSIFKQPNPVVASQRVARMRAKTSLPGLTRQSISFEKRILAKKDGCPDHPSTPRLRRVFGIGPPKPWRRRKSGHDECVCVTPHLQTHLRDLAAWFFCARYSFRPALQLEGAGNAGRPMRPIATCAKVVNKCTRVSRSHRNHPAFPTRWFTDYTVLSPVLGLFGHRHP
jgi:hypothetical protein